MSIEQLIASLRRDADADVTRIMTRAQEEAENLSRTIRDRQQRERDARIAHHRAEWQTRHRRALADARRHVIKRVLGAREQFLKRLFAQVRQRFSVLLTSPAYRRSLPNQLNEAMAFMGDIPVTIVVPRALGESIADFAKTRDNVRVHLSNEAQPGILIESDDDLVTVDNTLDQRLRQMMPQLSIDVLAQLHRENNAHDME